MGSKTDRGVYVIGCVTVKPHEKKSMLLGLYENTLSEPDLSLEFVPDVGQAMGARLERSDDDDLYCLVYSFHNKSNQTCMVTVRDVT
jgi:hypothetical protein